MTTATKEKPKKTGSSPLDEMLERGGQVVNVVYNPSIKLTNKAGTPGAWFKGYFVATRQVEVERKEGKETKKVLRPVHTFKFIASSEKATIQEGETYIPLEEEDINGKQVDIWGGGQMSDRLKNAIEGQEVGIEYLGKEEVDGYPQPLNQFRVVLVPLSAEK